MDKIVRVLSVDGGGIRGLVPARVLHNIEKLTNKPISELFDVMAGTSTGAIVVAGLTKKDDQGKPKYAPENIMHFYQQHGPDIFHSSTLRKLIHYVWCSKYSSDPLEKALKKYFHDDSLGDLMEKKTILIPAYDVHSFGDFMFNNQKEQYKSVPVSTVLLAATAAPTFFPPTEVQVKNEKHLLLDGGIYVNNPAVCAYVECRRQYPGREVFMLSIGTGFKPVTKLPWSIGVVFMLKMVHKIMFSASRKMTDYQMQEMLGSQYCRVGSVPLGKASEELDDASKENMDKLIQDADDVFKKERDNIEAFLKKIGA